MQKFIFNKLSSGKSIRKKIILAGISLLFSLSGFAHSNVEQENYDSFSLFFNPLFVALLSVIILLLIIIAVLGDALNKVGNASKERFKKNSTKILSLTGLLFLFSNQSVFANQVFYTSDTNSGVYGLSSGMFCLLLIIIIFELLIIAVLTNFIKLLAKTERKKPALDVIKEESSVFSKLNAAAEIEDEEEILLDHDYDGIRELDNNLPPWWKGLFYLTIVFAVVYLFHYHVVATGNLQIAEYDKSVSEALEAKAAFEKSSAGNITENNVKLITDKGALAEAETIFKENCAACHGQSGEGGVGPNFADKYWLHGGSLKDIFSSIKYGWPDKGMKSWQADLSPEKISKLTSYIKSFDGTNPPNQKEKQGELYEDVVQPDSLKTNSAEAKLPAVDSVSTHK